MPIFPQEPGDDTRLVWLPDALGLDEAAAGRGTRAGLLEGALGGALPVSLADTVATDALLARNVGQVAATY